MTLKRSSPKFNLTVNRSRLSELKLLTNISSHVKSPSGSSKMSMQYVAGFLKGASDLRYSSDKI